MDSQDTTTQRRGVGVPMPQAWARVARRTAQGRSRTRHGETPGHQRNEPGGGRAYRTPAARSLRLGGMTEAREELIHLIEELPEEKVDTLLATARALSTPPRDDGRPWPPAFFGSIKHASNGRTDNAARVDELLAETGFGQDFRG